MILWSHCQKNRKSQYVCQLKICWLSINTVCSCCTCQKICYWGRRDIYTHQVLRNVIYFKIRSSNQFQRNLLHISWSSSKRFWPKTFCCFAHYFYKDRNTFIYKVFGAVIYNVLENAFLLITCVRIKIDYQSKINIY